MAGGRAYESLADLAQQLNAAESIGKSGGGFDLLSLFFGDTANMTGGFAGRGAGGPVTRKAIPSNVPGPLPKGGGGHRARGGVSLGSGAIKPQAFGRNPHQEEKDFARQLRRKAAEARALSDVESDSANRQLGEKMRLVQQLLGGNKRYMTTERRTSQQPVNDMGYMRPMDLTETTQRDYTPEIQQQLMQLLFR